MTQNTKSKVQIISDHDEYVSLIHPLLRKDDFPNTVRHLALGVLGELGEFADAIKKARCYKDAEPDPVNVVEEIGDIVWYASLVRHIVLSQYSTDLELSTLKRLVRKHTSDISSVVNEAADAEVQDLEIILITVGSDLTRALTATLHGNVRENVLNVSEEILVLATLLVNLSITYVKKIGYNHAETLIYTTNYHKLTARFDAEFDAAKSEGRKVEFELNRLIEAINEVEGIVVGANLED